MDRLSRILFVTFILLLFPIMSHAACSIVIDGDELLCTDANGNVIEPFVYEGATYVPVRAVAQAFDTTVSWDQATKTVHIGNVGGNPVLGDNINIFANGKEFIPLDANGMRVYPILSEGATYLPLRGISQLFGKNIAWDNITQTAILSTPVNEDVLSYLTDAVTNTQSVTGLNVLLSVDGSISYSGELFSSVSNSVNTAYSPVGFSLSSFLPSDYTSNVSYMGNGNYFMVVSPDRFATNPDLQKALFEGNTPTSFSSLYIYASTKSGYITNVTIHFAGKLVYKDLTFDEVFKIQATMQYPDSFTFPLLPYPDNVGDNEKPVSSQGGENSDSALISKLVTNYVDYLISAQAKNIFALLTEEDYKNLFGNKSTAQINTDISALQKKLSSQYKDSDGSYSLDSLVYMESANSTSYHSAKAVVSINFSDGNDSWADEVEIFLIKKDGRWYIDLSTAQNLFK